jgi:hypothetical protein
MQYLTIDNVGAPKLVPFERPEDDYATLGAASDFRLVIDGHEVPYLTVRAWDVPTDPEQRATYIAMFEDRSPRLTSAMARGERIFNLTFDNRYGLTCPESDLAEWGWFMANAMAVSAGYTSHGKGSRPINRHGPSRT